MRIALTGAAGFIGRRAMQALADAGHTLAASDLKPGEGVEALDLRDRRAVAAWIERNVPDLVVHAGAISGPMLARDEPLVMLDVNAGGTLNLLEAMRTNGVSRMVLLSSIAVYGLKGPAGPVLESTALVAYDPYSASKIAGEAVLAAYAGAFGIAGAALRVSTVYGPGRVTPYIIADLIRAGRTGGSATVSGQTPSMRQYVHVDDVVRSIRLAVESPLAGYVPLNITSGSYLSEVAVAAIIRRHLPRLTVIADPARAGGDGDFGPLDIAAAARLIGYRPEVALEAGLARLIAES